MSLLESHKNCGKLLWDSHQRGFCMSQRRDVWQGTLALMVLRTLDVLGPQHGYGIARRIEQISEDLLAVNHGTLYPVLLKLEQEGSISSEWGLSENNRKAKFYRLTKAGRRQLESERRHWQQTTDIIARFFAVKGRGVVKQLRRFWHRLRRDHEQHTRDDEEFADEIESHLQMQMDENLRLRYVSGRRQTCCGTEIWQCGIGHGGLARSTGVAAP